MPNVSSPMGTTQPYIPAVHPSQIGRFAGLLMVFQDAARFQAAVAAEQANVAAGNAIWPVGQVAAIASEFAGGHCFRVWDGSHARTAILRPGLSIVLGSDTASVLFSAGAPAAETGADGDVSLDWASNTYYLKAGGAWASAGSLYAASSGAVVDSLPVIGVVQSNSERDNIVTNGRLVTIVRDKIAYHDLMRHDTLVNPLTGVSNLGTINYGSPLVAIPGAVSPPYWTDPGGVTEVNPTRASLPGMLEISNGIARFTSPVGYGSPAPSHRRVQANFPSISGRQRVAWDLSFRLPDEDDFPYDTATGWVYPFLLWQLKGAENPSLWLDCYTSPDGETATLNLYQKLSSMTGDTDTVRIQWNANGTGFLNAGSTRRLWEGTFKKGAWVDVVIEAFLDERKLADYTGGQGYINLYINDEQVLAYSGPTLNARAASGDPAPDHYWMVGIYRQESGVPAGAEECDLNRPTNPAPFKRVIDFRRARLLALTPQRQNLPDDGIIAVRGSDNVLTGTTAETNLMTVVIPGYTLKPGDVLSVHPIVENSSSANNKTLKVRFNGAQVWSSVNTTAQGMGPRVALRMRNTIASQVMEHFAFTGTAGGEGSATGTSAPAVQAIDFRVDQTLTVTGTLADGADTMTLRHCVVRIERCRGAVS